MEYRKTTKLLDNTQNQPFKFRTKYWVEINDDASGNYNTNSQIRLKNAVLKSSLCNFSEACILLTVADTSTPATGTNNANKKVIFKNCATFTDYIRKINNT